MKEGKKRNKPAASGVITLACALALASWPYPGENEAVRQQWEWYERRLRPADVM